jgi:hypothetical protein
MNVFRLKRMRFYFTTFILFIKYLRYYGLTLLNSEYQYYQNHIKIINHFHNIFTNISIIQVITVIFNLLMFCRKLTFLGIFILQILNIKLRVQIHFIKNDLLFFISFSGIDVTNPMILAKVKSDIHLSDQTAI